MRIHCRDQNAVPYLFLPHIIWWPRTALAVAACVHTALLQLRGSDCILLCPCSADPATKNIQTQRNGFGSFVQKFQVCSQPSCAAAPLRHVDGASFSSSRVASGGGHGNSQQ